MDTPTINVNDYIVGRRVLAEVVCSWLRGLLLILQILVAQAVVPVKGNGEFVITIYIIIINQ